MRRALDTPIGRWARRYGALIRAGWLVDLQYRAAIAIWLLWGVTEPAIALGIWWSIAGTGSVGGYGREELARYFFGVTLVNQLTLAWDAWHIDRWIRQGELNYRLTRPIDPVHEAIADNIANNLPVGLVAGSVAASDHLPAPVVSAILIGVDLGPNLSVTGSLATILWLVALRREKIEVGAWPFLKLGLLVTPPALIAALAAAIR